MDGVKSIKVGLATMFILVLILSLPFFFKRGIGMVDDTNFLIIAKWIKYGFRPYNDIAELKPPATYYLLYILNKFFGEAWWVSRIFIFLIDIFSSLLIVFFLNKKYGFFGWIAGISFYASLILLGGYRIHTDTFCALIGMLGIFWISQKHNYSFKYNLLFGIIIAIASLFKQSAIFYLIAYLLFLLINKKRVNRELISNMFFVILGFLFVWLITLFFLYRYSMLNNFITYAVIKPFLYPLESGGIKLFLRTPIVLVVLFFVILMIKRKKFNYNFTEFDALLLLVFVFSYIPVLARPASHYYICFLFALVILCIRLWMQMFDWMSIKNTFFKYILLILPSLHLIYGLIYGSIFFMRENRIRLDCLLTQQLGSIVHSYTLETEPILCFSGYYPASRFYYILERRPLFPYACMSVRPQEIKGKFQEILDTIKSGKVSVVIMEDTLDEKEFTVMPKEEFTKALSDKYTKIDFSFDKDYSRRRKAELYILKGLTPRKVLFKSNIFPRACDNS